jgi:hypothetical protein
MGAAALENDRQRSDQQTRLLVTFTRAQVHIHARQAQWLDGQTWRVARRKR